MIHFHKFLDICGNIVKTVTNVLKTNDFHVHLHDTRPGEREQSDVQFIVRKMFRQAWCGIAGLSECLVFFSEDFGT